MGIELLCTQPFHNKSGLLIRFCGFKSASRISVNVFLNKNVDKIKHKNVYYIYVTEYSVLPGGRGVVSAIGAVHFLSLACSISVQQQQRGSCHYWDADVICRGSDVALCADA